MNNPFETIELKLDRLNQDITQLKDHLLLTDETSSQKQDTYLTRKEAANRLRVSLVTLTEWVNRSKIKAYKIGGRVLFRENEVEEALARIVPLKYRRR